MIAPRQGVGHRCECGQQGRQHAAAQVCLLPPCSSGLLLLVATDLFVCCDLLGGMSARRLPVASIRVRWLAKSTEEVERHLVWYGRPSCGRGGECSLRGAGGAPSGSDDEDDDGPPRVLALPERANSRVNKAAKKKWPPVEPGHKLIIYCPRTSPTTCKPSARRSSR